MMKAWNYSKAFVQKNFPTPILRFSRHKKRRQKAQLTLPSGNQEAKEALDLFRKTSREMTSLIPWNPFTNVQACLHAVTYPHSKTLDIGLINQTEFSGVELFWKTANPNDRTLKVFVGGEATHPGIGELDDFIESLNFWKSCVQKGPRSLIVQTSANYYAIGGDKYINAALVADFTRKRVHILIKATVATNLDRFGKEPEKMFRGSPKVISWGDTDIGSAICLDSELLAEMLSGAPGKRKIALIPAFGDPSSGSDFPWKTLRISQDHQSVRDGTGTGSRVVVHGRPTSGLFDTLYNIFLETGEGAPKDQPLTPMPGSDQVTEEDDVMVGDKDGTVAVQKVTRPIENRDVISRLSVSNPVVLEIVATNPRPTVSVLKHVWDWLEKM